MNKEDLNNILVFLSRINLTGNEAPVFMDLIGKIKAEAEKIPEVPKVEKPEEKK